MVTTKQRARSIRRPPQLYDNGIGYYSSHSQNHPKDPVDLNLDEKIPENENNTEGSLVTLDGLFGSNRNWTSSCNGFTRNLGISVYASDLRNLRSSLAALPMTYDFGCDRISHRFVFIFPQKFIWYINAMKKIKSMTLRRGRKHAKSWPNTTRTKPRKRHPTPQPAENYGRRDTRTPDITLRVKVHRSSFSPNNSQLFPKKDDDNARCRSSDSQRSVICPLSDDFTSASNPLIQAPHNQTTCKNLHK
ncbi:hypothetical protein F5877DRAFT_67721 [Lentinula edodes]|nr:hypothetical protein F5877DRAFT_67721 [Lentinula edodes]